MAFGLPFSEVACKSGDGGGEHNGAEVNELGLGGGGAGVIGHLSILVDLGERVDDGARVVIHYGLGVLARAWGEIFPYVL
jgi:hypothetical protein